MPTLSTWPYYHIHVALFITIFMNVQLKHMHYYLLHSPPYSKKYCLYNLMYANGCFCNGSTTQAYRFYLYHFEFAEYLAGGNMTFCMNWIHILYYHTDTFRLTLFSQPMSCCIIYRFHEWSLGLPFSKCVPALLQFWSTSFTFVHPRLSDYCS